MDHLLLLILGVQGRGCRGLTNKSRKVEGHPEPLLHLALLPVEGHPEPLLVLQLAVHVLPVRQMVLQVVLLGRGIPSMGGSGDLVKVRQVLLQARVF